MNNKFEQIEQHQNPETLEMDSDEIQREIGRLAIEWDSLTEDQKVKELPGLGYN